MKKLNLKNIIIAIIIALSLIGTTIFVTVVVLGNNNGQGGTNDGGAGDGGDETPGYVDDGGWTDPE